MFFACFKRNKTFFFHFLAIKKAPKPQEDVASKKQCKKPLISCLQNWQNLERLNLGSKVEVCKHETLVWLASSSSPAGEEKPLTQIIQQFMQLGFSRETFTTANLPTALVMKPQGSSPRCLRPPPRSITSCRGCLLPCLPLPKAVQFPNSDRAQKHC